MQTVNIKRTSTLVGAALVATLVGVGASYWLKRQHAVQAPPSAALPAGAHQQLSGYTFTRSEGGRQVFTIHAARTVSFQGGAETSLEDVSVEVFGRAGRRHDLLRTASCQYDSSSGGFHCAGQVEVELNAASSSGSGSSGSASSPMDFSGHPDDPQSVYLETANLVFRPQTAVLSTDAPVRMRYGAWRGQGVGLEYGTKDERLEVARGVQLERPSPEGGAPWRLAADGLRYARNAQRIGRVELRGPIVVTDGARHIEADRASMFLDAANRATRAALEGSVRGSSVAPGETAQFSASQVRATFAPASQQLQTLTAVGNVQVESRNEGGRASVAHLDADQVELHLTGVHPLLQEGIATGHVKLSVQAASPAGRKPSAPTEGAQRETLTASELRFSFASAGPYLQEAATVGPGQLVLAPADPRAGERLVTAGQFVMGFDAHGRPANLRGLQSTHILFQPARDSPRSRQSPVGRGPVTSSSDALEARLDPSTQSVQTIEQTGNVRMEGRDGQATAQRAQYSAEAETVILTGGPRVWNAEARAGADRFVVRLDNNTAEGVGSVSSTHFGIGAGSAGGHTDTLGNKTPDDATHVLADHMWVDRASQVAHYEGNVRAWHGDDVLEAPWLDLDGRGRHLRAGDGVTTSDLQPAAPKPGQARAADTPDGRAATQPVTIRADGLEYFDAERQARYQGHVHMKAGDAAIESDAVDVFFSPAKSGAARIERALARGHVVMTQPQRRATASQAEYFATAGEVVLTGGPPTVYDAVNGFATGERLTLFVHDGSLILGGGTKSPALAKHHIAQ